MGFDLGKIAAAVRQQGRVARILVRSVKGSAPRDEGTSMLVWQGGQSGTIGGGALERQAILAAERLLALPGDWQRRAAHIPLGPELGQCCGGAVSLLTEIFGVTEVHYLTARASEAETFSRPLLSGVAPREDRENTRRGRWDRCEETFTRPRQPLWVYGAGHVGRALVEVLSALEFDLTWVDTDLARFPAHMPENVVPLVAVIPANAVAHAPTNAIHLVLTYSHAFDLDICHAILQHGFQSAGLIGSATKWARFQKRLLALGHTNAQIARITCPIGQPDLGKSPMAIAVGVAAALLKSRTTSAILSHPSKEFAS